MKNTELITVLSGYISALRAADDIGLDIADMVIGLINHKFPMPPVSTFVISTGKSMPIPNSFEINLGQLTSKLDMIKEYKNRTGCYLLEAKKLCEEYFAARGLEFYRRV